MQHRCRTLLTVCLALCILLGIVYLSANQSDYDKRTLMPYDYQDMATDAMYLEKGTYTFSFAYTYAPDAEVQIIRSMTADENNALPAILTSAALSEDGYTEITLTLPEAVHDLQLLFTKPVELGFTNIQSVGPVWRDTAAILLLIAIVAAVFLWLGRKPFAPTDARISEQSVRLVLLAVSVIATLPILRGYFINGHDLAYHLMRIENIKDGLLSGQFPVRVSPASWNELGYASSILYPEMFLYLPAVMRLCGVSLMVSYQIFVFLINLAAFFTAYYAIQRLTGKVAIGLIVSLVYGLSVNRAITLYLRGATDEVLALIFFPCVMLGMAEALHEGKLSKWLIAGMTGLIQSHIVNAEIAAFFCALYTIFALIFRKTTWRSTLCLAFTMGITILLNLWFLMPFALYSRGPYQMLVLDTRTMLHAVYPSQLFSSFASPIGNAEYLGTTVEMPLTVGVLPGIGVLLYIIAGNREQRDLRIIGHISLGFGAVALLIASTLFPWTYVAKIPVLGELLFSVQFPWRYLGIAGFFLAVVFGIAAYGIGRESGKTLIAACLIVTVFNIAPFIDQFVQSDKLEYVMQNKTDVSALYSFSPWDYDTTDSDFSTLPGNPSIVVTMSDDVAISNFSTQGTHVTFDYASDTDQSVTLPLYLYPGYAAELNGKQALEAFDSGNHLLALSLPAGSGTVNVCYRGFWYFNTANYVSLLTVVLLALWAALKRWRRRC